MTVAADLVIFGAVANAPAAVDAAGTTEDNCDDADGESNSKIVTFNRKSNCLLCAISVRCVVLLAP